MDTPTEIRRVVVVVLDGLRPDAIDAFDLKHLRRLAHNGASTMVAQTVSPSITWPALTSLLTGVAPDVHGVLSDSVHVPRRRAKLAPLPELLLRCGYRSSAFLGEVPLLYRPVASRIAERLGFTEARFKGASASEVLMAARPTLAAQQRGMIFLHWADADRIGHEHGWMSPEYGEAAQRLDHALGLLVSSAELETDPRTLLIALADHGGGGLVANDHEGAHPLNTTIPLVLAGAAATCRQLGSVSLLDIPATIAWLLGLTPPSIYSGRVLAEAFEPADASAVA